MKRESKYRELASQLRTAIATGEYPAGATIPSQIQLGEIFNVSQMTVRKAVDLLEHDGYIRKGNGRGNGSVVLVRTKERIRRRIGYNFGVIGRPRILDTHNHDLPAVANGMVHELTKWDAVLSILPFLTEEYPSAMSFVHCILEKNLVDGFFVFELYEAEELCEFLSLANIPFVRVMTFRHGTDAMNTSNYPLAAIDELDRLGKLLKEARAAGRTRVILLAAEEDLMEGRTHQMLQPLTQKYQLDYRVVEAGQMSIADLREELAACCRKDILTLSSTPLLHKLDLCLSLEAELNTDSRKLVIYQHYADIPHGLIHDFEFIQRPFKLLGVEAAKLMKQLVELKMEGKKICGGQHIILNQY